MNFPLLNIFNVAESQRRNLYSGEIDHQSSIYKVVDLINTQYTLAVP